MLIGVSQRRGTAFQARKPSYSKMWWNAMRQSCLNSLRTCCISWQPSWTPTLWCQPVFLWVTNCARINCHFIDSCYRNL